MYHLLQFHFQRGWARESDHFDSTATDAENSRGAIIKILYMNNRKIN